MQCAKEQLVVLWECLEQQATIPVILIWTQNSVTEEGTENRTILERRWMKSGFISLCLWDRTYHTQPSRRAESGAEFLTLEGTSGCCEDTGQDETNCPLINESLPCRCLAWDISRCVGRGWWWRKSQEEKMSAWQFLSMLSHRGSCSVLCTQSRQYTVA